MRKTLSFFSIVAATLLSAAPVQKAQAATCGTSSADLCKPYPAGWCGFVYNGEVYHYPGEYINDYGQS